MVSETVERAAKVQTNKETLAGATTATATTVSTPVGLPADKGRLATKIAGIASLLCYCVSAA
jgi:hypothetical protein